MSRKKLILSILLMAALVLVGIVLPAMHRNQASGQTVKKKNVHATGKKAKKSSTEGDASLSKIQYLGFEDLETFLPSVQIEDLKTQMSSYLQKSGYTDITSITFLVDETSYPSNGQTLFQFVLSDGSKLPVTCLTADGTFTFGKENQQTDLSGTSDTRIYTRQTDNSLPTVTTEEIEAMQESGYADTESTDGNTASDSTERTTQNNSASHTGNSTEEVAP